MTIKTPTLALAFAILTSSAGAQVDLFVDASATGGNGTQQSPYGTIQQAVDAASPQATIHVAPGTYDPFSATVPVSIQGSTAAASTVVFDSGAYEECKIAASSGVVSVANMTFDGLADSVDELGLLLEGGTDYVVQDCVFTGLGRGLNVDFVTTAIIERCTFTRGEQAIQCEGLASGFGFIRVTECEFTHNVVGGSLIAISKDGFQSSVENCVFRRNIGRLLFADCLPQLLIRSSEFHDSSIPVGFGGIWGGAFLPIVDDCLFTGPANGALLATSSTPLFHFVSEVRDSRFEGHPTGHRAPLAANVDLIRCTVTGLDAGPASLMSSGLVENCTLVGNRTQAPGSLVTGVSAVDSILVEHDGSTLGNAVTVAYSLVDGGAPGTGNITGSPRFVGPLAGNFALRPDSPCIGAGVTQGDIGVVQFAAPFTPTSSSFCNGIRTSEGCVPAISGSDFASLSPGATTELSANLLPAGTFGLFFFSPNGQTNLLSGALLCTGGPSERSAVVQTTGVGPCGGQATVALTSAELLNLGHAPGDYLYAQFIARDVPNPNGLGITLTPALEMVVEN